MDDEKTEDHQEDLRQRENAGVTLAPDGRTPGAGQKIIEYLSERVPVFRELAQLRAQGWENPEGDKFFEKQRKKADKSSEHTELFFYGLMKRIAQEMHSNTGALKVQNTSRPDILDMCMAPGGFLETVLKLNPGSRALGFTLPSSHGGHRVHLPMYSNVTLKYLDITMLAADMGVPKIPADHEDAKNFLPTPFEGKQEFDIVLCDGQVLRTHNRASYREPREARRLSFVQLALGLEHMKRGGTMVMLLHKLEGWDNVLLLQTFSKFSRIGVYKPKQGHAKRSSFYMVAKNVDGHHPDAVRAIKEWKEGWRVATFGTDAEYWDWFRIRRDEPDVAAVLENFGPMLIELGTPVWKVQAEALAKAPFVTAGRGRSLPAMPAVE